MGGPVGFLLGECQEAEKDAKNYAARGIPMNLNWL